MLDTLFPEAHPRYRALPLLGCVLDDFATWMSEQGYQRSTLRVEFKTLRRLDRLLRQRDAKHAPDITPEVLEACWADLRSRNDHTAGAIVHSLRRYLEARGRLQPAVAVPASPTQERLETYRAHLIHVRGFAYNTIRDHLATAAAFLDHLSYDTAPSRLPSITSSNVEAFIRRSGERLGRGSLEHLVGQLRGFLRFLAAEGSGPVGLDTQIDMPRCYRFEQLPRALPWTTVQKFLHSIARTGVHGLRDYAMFLLIATYGLRVSEIAALTLDDVRWRAARIHIPMRKRPTGLILPLTDNAATALVDYLRHGRPSVAHRSIFLRVRAPIGPLKPTAVSMAFASRAKQSGLDIPFFGAHCLRHSYAVHLLHQGTPLKTIGDLLGHVTAEATCMYLRLATEDLREVPLPVPRTAPEVDGKVSS